jgi:RNA polymerase sigma-32 factor
MVANFDEKSALANRAMKAEMLDPEVEYNLAVAWRDHKDEKSLDRLIKAYMRLAISTASKFRRYGAPQNDLVQEAAVGLMKAAEKFDPDRGVRFSTYAIWWIKASIQDYVMRNWSLVRTGSTSDQKSLFFNLRRVQAQIQRDSEDQGLSLGQDVINMKISEELGVPLRTVELMQGRLSGSDFSLNVPQSAEEDGREWIDLLEDENLAGEAAYELVDEQKKLKEWVDGALDRLNPREQFIISERRLSDTGRTLESLGKELGLSKERVRQLEAAAFTKMRKNLNSNDALKLMIN